MNNCCGGMGIGMMVGGILVLIVLVLLILWLIKQVRK